MSARSDLCRDELEAWEPNIWSRHECSTCGGTGIGEAGEGPNIREAPCQDCRHDQYLAAETEFHHRQATAAKSDGRAA